MTLSTVRTQVWSRFQSFSCSFESWTPFGRKDVDERQYGYRSAVHPVCHQACFIRVHSLSLVVEIVRRSVRRSRRRDTHESQRGGIWGYQRRFNVLPLSLEGFDLFEVTLFTTSAVFKERVEQSVERIEDKWLCLEDFFVSFLDGFHDRFCSSSLLEYYLLPVSKFLAMSAGLVRVPFQSKSIYFQMVYQSCK